MECHIVVTGKHMRVPPIAAQCRSRHRSVRNLQGYGASRAIVVAGHSGEQHARIRGFGQLGERPMINQATVSIEHREAVRSNGFHHNSFASLQHCRGADERCAGQAPQTDATSEDKPVPVRTKHLNPGTAVPEPKLAIGGHPRTTRAIQVTWSFAPLPQADLHSSVRLHHVYPVGANVYNPRTLFRRYRQPADGSEWLVRGSVDSDFDDAGQNGELGKDQKVCKHGSPLTPRSPDSRSPETAAPGSGQPESA